MIEVTEKEDEETEESLHLREQLHEIRNVTHQYFLQQNPNWKPSDYFRTSQQESNNDNDNDNDNNNNNNNNNNNRFPWCLAYTRILFNKQLAYKQQYWNFAEK